jgi:hypothetical protein
MGAEGFLAAAAAAPRRPPNKALRNDMGRHSL